MAGTTNITKLNAPNKKIVYEMLNYIDASFGAVLPTASKGEITRCKEQFMKEYDAKWKEQLDAEKLRKLDIKDRKLDKLEDEVIRTTTLRINKRQESAKEFAEKINSSYEQILKVYSDTTQMAKFKLMTNLKQLTSAANFGETPLKELNASSKSESQELRKRCLRVLKDINDFKETGKNLDTAILKLQKDNVEYFQD